MANTETDAKEKVSSEKGKEIHNMPCFAGERIEITKVFPVIFKIKPQILVH